MTNPGIDTTPLVFDVTTLVHKDCNGVIERARPPAIATYCVSCQRMIPSKDAVETEKDEA